ncbi:sulfur carrier protein ThiS [Geobacter sp. DSM 9736]|uniref:sulfur carrier protein ThiS n=1 Tax=Geobacter sp. DSM 9736 TaxID=1277350 RepID=UPI000B51013A|nr:sulfur carrier protein ThiS [Geobacter sp. DSM 9736]SNB48072.1 sulfur carrier protein [Geobacter sp. DSM 9736]
MQITVNGELQETKGATVLELLQELDIDPRRIAIELNLEILPKMEYEKTRLKSGDRIEIVHFVGGGASCINTADTTRGATDA